ncbi:MAG: hypothetical protein IAG10_22700 [Planctomycetaceae bacterium]|nr:hypothetical protein [Planctomycetaceae bacterium]
MSCRVFVLAALLSLDLAAYAEDIRVPAPPAADTAATDPVAAPIDSAAAPPFMAAPAPVFLNRVPYYLDDVDPRFMRRAISPQGQRMTFGAAAPFFDVSPTFTVNPVYLLPAPDLPQDMTLSRMPDEGRLGQPTELGILGLESAEAPGKRPYFRLGGGVVFAAYFDSGFVNNSSDSNLIDTATIAIDGTDEARKRGQFFMSTNLSSDAPITLLLDSQILDLGPAQGQFLVEANNFRSAETLQTQQLFVRAWNKQRTSLVLGQADTVFGDAATSPRLLQLNDLPVGFVTRKDRSNTVQIRIDHDLSDAWQIAASIENPQLDDVLYSDTPADPRERLKRWPDFVVRARYIGENGWDSLQVAGLCRSLGFQQDAGEHFRTGWGISVLGRIANGDQSLRAFAGVSGGRGVGDYINGISLAATAPDNMQLILADAMGAYAGLERVWLWDADDQSVAQLSSNVGYGYAAVDDNGGFLSSGSLNRKLQMAWGNLVWRVSQNVAFGFEYQYGRREVDNGQSGENHRALFVATLATGGKSQTLSAMAAGAPVPDKMAPQAMMTPLPAPSPQPVPAFRRRL